MRTTAGGITLLGLLLGAYVNPDFYALPYFISAGLIFSGLTGWCGMTKFLALMPWNK